MKRPHEAPRTVIHPADAADTLGRIVTMSVIDNSERLAAFNALAALRIALGLQTAEPTDGPTDRRSELDRALAAFGEASYAVMVHEHSPETSPREIKVEVWRLYLDGGARFVKAKTQAEGDVLGALTFIRDRWISEVKW